MEQTKQKKEGSDIKINHFENRLKNRFYIEGNSLLSPNLDYSNLFEKDSSISEDYTIIKIKFERATLREASNFKNFMENAIVEDNRNLIVDLNECEFIDSSFFGVLVSGVKRLKTMNKKFKLVFNSENKLPIFSATGLDKVFNVFNSIEEAIKA
jgi:anti-anti-sigma factor